MFPTQQGFGKHHIKTAFRFTNSFSRYSHENTTRDNFPTGMYF